LIRFFFYFWWIFSFPMDSIKFLYVSIGFYQNSIKMTDFIDFLMESYKFRWIFMTKKTQKKVINEEKLKGKKLINKKNSIHKKNTRSSEAKQPSCYQARWLCVGPSANRAAPEGWGRGGLDGGTWPRWCVVSRRCSGNAPPIGAWLTPGVTAYVFTF